MVLCFFELKSDLCSERGTNSCHDAKTCQQQRVRAQKMPEIFWRDMGSAFIFICRCCAAPGLCSEYYLFSLPSTRLVSFVSCFTFHL
jgi:hypothetical protein